MEPRPAMDSTSSVPPWAVAIDRADYDFWVSQFGTVVGTGSSLGASAPIPEPSSAVLLMVLGCVALGMRATSHR